MKRLNNLPVGYLKCMNCGDPAMWIIDDITYIPTGNGKTVDMQVKYRLVNVKIADYDPEVEKGYLCDSCGKKIDESNYVDKCIIFLEKLEKDIIQ